MNKVWRWIKWKWWFFRLCEHDKAALDAVIYGTSMMKNGKRVPPSEWMRKDEGAEKGTGGV